MQLAGEGFSCCRDIPEVHPISPPANMSNTPRQYGRALKFGVIYSYLSPLPAQIARVGDISRVMNEVVVREVQRWILAKVGAGGDHGGGVGRQNIQSQRKQL